jgi:hypothetical protein
MKTTGITAALAAQDLGRAKAFYVEKVGLQALESDPGWRQGGVVQGLGRQPSRCCSSLRRISQEEAHRAGYVRDGEQARASHDAYVPNPRAMAERGRARPWKPPVAPFVGLGRVPDKRSASSFGRLSATAWPAAISSGTTPRRPPRPGAWTLTGRTGPRYTDMPSRPLVHPRPGRIQPSPCGSPPHLGPVSSGGRWAGRVSRAAGVIPAGHLDAKSRFQLFRPMLQRG